MTKTQSGDPPHHHTLLHAFVDLVSPKIKAEKKVISGLGRFHFAKGIIIPTRLKFDSVNFEYWWSGYEKKDSIRLKWNRPSSRKYARWVFYYHFQETQLGQKRGL